MKKIIYLLIISLFLFLPIIANAEDEYVDKVYDIVGESNSDTVTIYFFHSNTCPHCKAENTFLDTLASSYGNEIVIKRYEISSSQTNNNYLRSVKQRFNVNSSGVPFTVIGDNYFMGYTSATANNMQNTIDTYLGNQIDDENESPFLEDETEEKQEVSDENNNMELPIMGTVNIKEVSIPLVAIVLGIVDGFNPCAMWILLFLINMLFTMKDRKKMWLLGLTFLFTSAFVYFLAMLGLSVILSYTAITWVRIIIALVAIIGGIINLISYVKTPKDGCNIVDDKKRKKYFVRIKKFTAEQNLLLALLGVIALAASVNIVELACSAGFPTIFVTILDLNNIAGIHSVLYILLYIVFFLIDDIVIFVIAMTTLKITGVTTKYNKLSHLVGGIIMILMGILLIFKPEWIMLNF